MNGSGLLDTHILPEISDLYKPAAKNMSDLFTLKCSRHIDRDTHFGIGTNRDVPSCCGFRFIPLSSIAVLTFLTYCNNKKFSYEFRIDNQQRFESTYNHLNSIFPSIQQYSFTRGAPVSSSETLVIYLSPLSTVHRLCWTPTQPHQDWCKAWAGNPLPAVTYTPLVGHGSFVPLWS